MPWLDTDARKVDFYTRFDEQRPKRAAALLLLQAGGMSTKEMAKVAGLGVETVKAEVKWAKRQHCFEGAQDRLYGLLDQAAQVYEQALTNKNAVTGDKEVARDLLNGLGLLGKHATLSIEPPSEAGRETFEVWRARFSRPAHAAGPAGLPAGADRGGLEGHLAVEAGAEGLGAPGNEPGVATDAGIRGVIDADFASEPFQAPEDPFSTSE